MSHETQERLAIQMCHEAGGEWNKKRTKRNHWRAKAARLMAKADESAGLTLTQTIFWMIRWRK